MPIDGTRADLFELANDNGTLHWIDLTTGRQFTSGSPSFESAQREAELLAPVLRVFTEHGYQVDSSRSTLNATIEGRRATYQLGVFANGDRDIVCSYTFVATPVPPHRRAAVAQAMTRINARLWLGNFEMDPQDGYMRFRLNADLEGGELTPAVAERLVHAGGRAWDEYYDMLIP